MRKQGYLLLYVLFLLTFLSIVALYSFERLQLSAQIEGNRRSDIIASAKERSALQSFFQEEAQGMFSEFLVEYFKKPSKMPSAGPFTYSLTSENGELIDAVATVDVENQEIQWSIPTQAQQFHVVQRYQSIFDATSQNGGETLESKIDFFKTVSDYGVDANFYLEGDIDIRLKGQYWIIEKVIKEPIEKPIEEPLKEPELTETPVSEEAHEEPEDSEITEEITETEESPITETTEFPEEETESPEETEEYIEKREELGRFHYQSTVFIHSEGNLSIEHSSRMGMNCILIHNGSFSAKNVRLAGIVLHEGAVESAEKCDIVGFYETDTIANLSKVQFIWQPKTTYQMGAEIPGFFTYSIQQMR